MSIEESLVVVYWGGRGGGKTLSMSVDAFFALISGLSVWSNYPISFSYRYANGKVVHYQSLPIEVEQLLDIQNTDIRNGKICLDEWNLWCNSRRSGAVLNYAFNGVIQLIRKRHLSFGITTQIFGTLDKFVRDQTDVTVLCRDLHYKYRNIPKGHVIAQRLVDWSGIFCGDPVFEKDRFSRLRNTRDRMLKGSIFHGIYDTEQEYDLMDIWSQRYKINRTDKIIGSEDTQDVFIQGKLNELKEILVYSGETKIESTRLQEILNERGLKGSLHGDLGRAMKQIGFKYKPSRKGNFYYVSEDA